MVSFLSYDGSGATMKTGTSTILIENCEMVALTKVNSIHCNAWTRHLKKTMQGIL